jgi:hypothetical protein
MGVPKHGNGYKPTRDYTRERHFDRTLNGRSAPDPQLVEGWDSLQLYWLAHVPGYREEVKRRVSEARKRQMLLDQRLLRREWGDVDRLGREVEGCG